MADMLVTSFMNQHLVGLLRWIHHHTIQHICWYHVKYLHWNQ